MKRVKFAFWLSYFAVFAISMAYYIALRTGWGPNPVGDMLHSVGRFSIMSFPASLVLIFENYLPSPIWSVVTATLLAALIYWFGAKFNPSRDIWYLGLVVLYLTISYALFFMFAALGLFL